MPKAKQTTVSAETLLRGAWYALEQCGVDVRDAVALFEMGAYSNAVLLALIAQEELGRHKILVDMWRQIATGGAALTVEVVRQRCDDHAQKLRQFRIDVLYVDLKGSGTEWNRPSELSRTEARETVSRVAKSYASASSDFLTPGVLDEKLETAVSVLPNLPHLPTKSWPPP